MLRQPASQTNLLLQGPFLKGDRSRCSSSARFKQAQKVEIRRDVPAARTLDPDRTTVPDIFIYGLQSASVSKMCSLYKKKYICVSLTEFIYCQMIRVEGPLALFSKNRLIFMSLFPVFPVFPVLACFIQRIHYCVDHLVDVRFV